MTTLRKILISLTIVGAVGAVAGAGAFSAFSKTTSNDNNTITAGNVTIGDNDSNAAAYSLATAKPGDSARKCIKVTYTGNLASNVKLYRSAFSGTTGLESVVDLSITKGTGNNTDCSDFSAGTSVYSGTLSAFSATSWSNGISLLNPSNSATWSTNDAVTYEIKATLQSGAASSNQSLTTGTHSFTWEAQNT